MMRSRHVMRVTVGQVGQLVFLQDSLYFVTGPFSTVHLQCVHTSNMTWSPVWASEHIVWRNTTNNLKISNVLKTYCNHCVIENTSLNRGCKTKPWQWWLLLTENCFKHLFVFNFGFLFPHSELKYPLITGTAIPLFSIRSLCVKGQKRINDSEKLE